MEAVGRASFFLRERKMSTTSNYHGDVHSYPPPAKDTRPEQESRRVFRVPVRIWGMNGSGSPFTQQAHTVDAGLLGACLEGLAHQVVAGEVLGVEYRERKTRFRVVWVGQSGTPDAGKVELSPLDKTEDFWRLQTTVTKEQREPGERRTTPRCACKGSTQIRQAHTRFPQGASVSDISLNGCYVELMTIFPVGTKVDLLIRVAEFTVNCSAEVRTSHPGVGMGMVFVQMSETDRSALEKAVTRLSSSGW
jgi:hypothetical protein